jgi:hypothetical protein
MVGLLEYSEQKTGDCERDGIVHHNQRNELHKDGAIALLALVHGCLINLADSQLAIMLKNEYGVMLHKGDDYFLKSHRGCQTAPNRESPSKTLFLTNSSLCSGRCQPFRNKLSLWA